MKRNLYIWQFAGFVMTVLGGTLLHFLYGLTNESVLAAPFSAINESTWEHMKLMYFPLVVFALIQSRFSREHNSFWCIKLFGIITGLVLIPVLFYTYNGAFGKSPDWLNIAIFFLSAAIVFILETLLFIKNRLRCEKGLDSICYHLPYRYAACVFHLYYAKNSIVSKSTFRIIRTTKIINYEKCLTAYRMLPCIFYSP